MDSLFRSKVPAGIQPLFSAVGLPKFKDLTHDWFALIVGVFQEHPITDVVCDIVDNDTVHGVPDNTIGQEILVRSGEFVLCKNWEHSIELLDGLHTFLVSAVHDFIVVYH